VKKIPGQLEASFLIFLTLGSIKQSNTKPNPNASPPRGCLSNSLSPVWANMYSDPFSSTTPAAAGIDNPDCVKWRETLPSQEECAGRDIPVGQLVTKVLVSRESPLPPCQLWPGHNSPILRRWEPGPDRCPHPRVDCGWMVSVVRTAKTLFIFNRKVRPSATVHGPGPDGPCASYWYGTLHCDVQKLTLSVCNNVKSPGQSFHELHFLDKMAFPF